ncbi:BRCA1-associated ATM activator 1-like [Mya arenaria]|uniref:BRCA1-associated ATM activator 1-like n=1 Tax=Mya arenaria TaxID=6604 RepID=UPI0022E4EC70|nr:BRCA1-associated ATM activator 1-like [Mya arenaria]
MSASDISTKTRILFSFFQKNHLVHDDTVLHSLIDSLAKTVHSEEQLETAGVCNFLRAVSMTVDEYDSQIVTFALNIATWIVQGGGRFHNLQTTVVQLIAATWEIHSTFENKTVIEALFKCLKEMTEYRYCFQMLITNTTDIVTQSLETAVSGLFLTRAKSDFIAAVIKNAFKFDDLGQQLGTNILQTLMRGLNEFTINSAQSVSDKSENGQFRFTVDVLRKCCTQSDRVLKYVVSHQTCLDDIQGLALCLDGSDFQIIVDFLFVLRTQGNDTKSNLILRDLLTTFCQRAEFYKAQKMSEVSMKGLNDDIRDLGISALTQPLEFGLFVQTQVDKFSRNLLYPRDQLHLFMRTSKAASYMAKSIVLLTDNDVQCVESVSALLSTSGDGVWPALHISVRNKLQCACLKYLCSVDVKYYLPKLGPAVLGIMKQSDIDFVLYKNCTSCLIRWFPDMLDNSETVSVTNELGLVIQLHLSALQWEIRDTALEFVTEMVNMYNGNMLVLEWILTYNIECHVWTSVDDGESYVRGSAITALHSLLHCKELQGSLKSMRGVTINSAVEKVIQVLEEDTEGFARRAAATFLQKQLQANEMDLTMIHNLTVPLMKAVNDFDWEVKSTALDCIEMLLNREFLSISSQYFSSAIQESVNVLEMSHSITEQSEGSAEARLRGLEQLNDCGVIHSLVLCLNDYDQQIREKGLAIFKVLQHAVKRDSMEKYVLRDGCVLNKDKFVSIVDTILAVRTDQFETYEDENSKLLSVVDDIVSTFNNTDIDEENIIDCY